MNKIFKIAAIFLFAVTRCFGMEVPIYNFSLDPYDQNADTYLQKNSPDYEKLLLKPAYQQYQLNQFYTHYYATDELALSPWSKNFVNSVIDYVYQNEVATVTSFDNEFSPSIHYGFNFKEHDLSWLNKIKKNMNFSEMGAVGYKSANRAIAINNTLARELPTQEPDFYHSSQAGQGYPFDNLQSSAIWAGTPLYILNVSVDKTWSFVLTPDAYFAWVKSSDIANVSNQFIQEWQSVARKNMAAITKTDATINANGTFYRGYLGQVFPLVKNQNDGIQVLFPVEGKNNQAILKIATLTAHSAERMPIPASQKNIAKLLKELQNRPYGWGGSYFFNDCSQELKSLFTPLGIWLPRNSAAQSKLGPHLDLANSSTSERIHQLKTLGHPLMTIIYVKGHVMLYVGNKNHEAITYQNLWGLSNAARDKRFVVGQSVFFPLLQSFSQSSEIVSQASKPNFTLVYLDELVDKTPTPKDFVKKFISTNIQS